MTTATGRVPHWHPRCSHCGWRGPDFGTMAPTEMFVCGGCGREGDAWHIRVLPHAPPADD